MEVTYDKETGSKYSYSLGVNYCNPKSKSEKGSSKLEFGVENIFNRDDIVSNYASAKSTKYYCLPRNVHITYTYTF